MGFFTCQFNVKNVHELSGTFIVYARLTFSLQDDGVSSAYGEYTTYMQRHWTCPKCEQRMIVTVVEKLQHEQQCSTQVDSTSQGRI